jgi:hypothetical protein
MAIMPMQSIQAIHDQILGRQRTRLPGVNGVNAELEEDSFDTLILLLLTSISPNSAAWRHSKEDCYYSSNLD